MATIHNESILIEVSKLFRDNVEVQSVLSDEQLAVLKEVVEATVAELLADPALVVEVNRIEK